MSHLFRIFSALSLLAVLASACAPQTKSDPDQIKTLAAQTVSVVEAGLTQTAVVEQAMSSVQTQAAQTAQAVMAQTAAANPVATTTPLPPTITPATVFLPTATTDLTSGATELFFKAGGTSVVDSGSLAAGATRRLKLRLGASQLLTLTMSSSADVSVSVQGQNGSVLRAPAALMVWKSFLPTTQYYIITLYAPVASNYSLNIVVPARLTFASGSNSTSYSGPIAQPDTVEFLARGNAGQTMSVTLTSAGSDVLLTIYGLDDGSPLVRYVSGATSWTGSLPGTQDYVIEARATGSSTSFTVTVTIN